MNTGKPIFAQLIDFLPIHHFRKCVKRYNGQSKVRSFSCWDQFLCLAFAQLTYRESLRDIEVCLRAVRSKLYHLGFRGQISRSTLADANEQRDYRIFADFAQVVIHRARKLYTDESFVAEIDGIVYALDATTGDERWRFEARGDILSSPAVVDGVVYVGSKDNYVYALDATTGWESWHLETGGQVLSSPTVVNGVVYIGSDDGYVYALDAGGG